jgi:cobaltochelatase CobS
VRSMSDEKGREIILQMVRTAEQKRIGFQAGDISTLMSPRTVISWADNFRIFGDLDYAFATAFLNRCDEPERPVVAEYYERSTGRSLDLAATSPWKRVD